jgi:predicted RNase H-like nuclease (RuvC/YqgF family)
MSDKWQERALNAEAEVEGLERERAGDDMAIGELRAEVERLREECRLAAELQIRTGQEADTEIDRLRTALQDMVDTYAPLARMGAGHPALDQARKILIRPKEC